MAKIDIRNNGDDPITQIVFAEYDGNEEIIEIDSNNTITIKDCGGTRVFIYHRDLHNLIKALQKVQELWAVPN